MIKLPGLIDPHVHLRDPGQVQKEDFSTGTKAAVAGGFTTIIDMPNNAIPITTSEKLIEKQQIAKEKIFCDVGFHFGSIGDNIEEFPKVQDRVSGLKLYFNQTTGGYIIPIEKAKTVFTAWPSRKPILVHAEEYMLESVLKNSKIMDHHIHVCHVSTEKELKIIMKAKEDGQNITCGVTPHHLFLSIDNEELLGPYGIMKPSLKPQTDINFLWHHLDTIDIIESDHAPHTIEEKESDIPPYGVPGLETTLPLLLTAVHTDKLTIKDIQRLCHNNPAKIFNIKTDADTYIEIDENEEWTIKNENLFTKCKWSPFDGWKMKGKVKRVFLRGTKVYENGKILAKPGTGQILTDE